jgi:rod shape-determining protein MreB and related proteins
MTGTKVAIDLGTVNSLVQIEGKGIVLREPTVIAYSRDSKKVIAVGSSAKDMIGRNPQGIVVKRPLRQGVIASYKLTEALLRYLLVSTIGRFSFFRPDLMISVPAGLTSVEERAVVKAGRGAGAGRVGLIPEPIAASIGAGLPVGLSGGNMIINMGGGTVEAAVVSMHGLVTFESKRVSGDAIDTEIKKFLKNKYQLLVGDQMVEKIKMGIGCAIELDVPYEMPIRGNNLVSGQPEIVRITSNDLLEPIRVVLREIIQSVKNVLETTPPELTADIIDRGISLSGGTSLLREIDSYFTEALGVSCHLVENPLTAVVEGVGKVLENPKDYMGVVKYY